MKKVHIKNGHVIDPASGVDGLFDVILEKGVVSALVKSGSKVEGAEVIDAKGCIVAPGFVDLHVHLREPGFEYKETIATGTQSAAVGGFTSVCCMANTNPVNDAAPITEYILKKAREQGIVNVYPIGALTKKLEGKELSHMGEMKQAGCVAFSDDGKCVGNAQLMRLAMEYARTFEAPVITHSVDPCLSHGGVMNEGFLSTRLGLPGIPNQAEDIMISRDIYLAELTGCRLHIAHVSTAEGVEIVRRAKAKGLPVTCEATPHHFTLTDEAIGNYDTNAKMAPPLRSEADREAIVAGLADGTIDAVATDHAPHAVIDKEIEFATADCGVIGMECALSLTLRLFHTGCLGLKRVVELLSTNPARVVGLPKGSLKVGADADVTVFDPHVVYKIDASLFRSKSLNSPFIGMEVQGRVRHTLVGGKTVFSWKEK